MRITSFSTPMVLAALLVLAIGCRGKSDMGAAKSSAGGAGGGFHLLVESGVPEATCVSEVIGNTTFDYDLAAEASAACNGFESPGVLLSMDSEDVIGTLAEQIAASCDVETRVVEGKIEWRLRVTEAGTSTDCMTAVLKAMVPNTDSADWEPRVSQGQVVHSSPNFKAMSSLERRLEQKCGCKLEREAVY